VAGFFLRLQDDDDDVDDREGDWGGGVVMS
jgi:hypothetical protein